MGRYVTRFKLMTGLLCVCVWGGGGECGTGGSGSGVTARRRLRRHAMSHRSDVTSKTCRPLIGIYKWREDPKESPPHIVTSLSKYFGNSKRKISLTIGNSLCAMLKGHKIDRKYTGSHTEVFMACDSWLYYVTNALFRFLVKGKLILIKSVYEAHYTIDIKNKTEYHAR
jgi:hypothetical protein